MAIIEKKIDSGSVRYLVRVRDPGGRWFPSKTFERKRDAERHERELKGAKDQGVVATSRAAREVTVADFFREWAVQRAHTVSRGWHASRRQMAEDYVLPSIGHFRVGDVRPQQIGAILSGMAETGLGEQMRLHVYSLLSQMFSDAVEYFGLVLASPVMKRDRPKVRRIERRFLTTVESRQLLRVSEKHYLGPALWLGLLTGLRPSEIQALRWESVDFDKGQILVCAAFKRRIGVIEPFPKQKDWGKASMPAALVDYLKPRRLGKAAHDFVAPGQRGGMLEQKKLHDGLKKLCLAAGVKVISPHELRHSCTELWIEVGATLEDLRRQLNHKHTETTLRYVHRSDDRLQSIAANIVMPTVALRCVQ